MPADSIRAAQTATVTELSNLIPKISPQSPNMAAFNRYGEQPVNLFTGMPAIEIPLVDVNAGPIHVPIVLSYHAGGHKVTDAASWVGLGWSLQPGGAITRQQRSVADEATTVGLLGKAIIEDPYAYFNTPSCYNADVEYYYRRLATNQLDAEQDIFSLRTPQKSNQFVLRSETNAQWLNPEPSIISFSRANNAFTLLDEQSIRYDFATPEQTADGYPNAWLINTIQAHQTADEVRFAYHPAINYQRVHDIVESQTINDLNTGQGNNPSYPPVKDAVQFSSVSTAVFGRLPAEVVFPGGKLVFELQPTDRQDIDGKALNRLLVYGHNVTTSAYELIKWVQFNYTYYTRSGGSGTEKVLILTGFDWQDVTGRVINTHRFTYNTANALPYVQSKAKDYWGYANGQTGNTTLIPAQAIATATPTGTEYIGGGNREPNEAAMKAWLLTAITYPTGGSVAFDYEAHQYLDGTTTKKAGGLRIRQITRTADATSLPVITSYRYGTSRDANGRLRQPIKPGYETEQTTKYCYRPGGGPSNTPTSCWSYRSRRYTSNAILALFPQEGAAVTYTNVTEYQDNGSSGTGSQGRTEYIFRDSDDERITLNRSAKYYLNSRHWNRGQLLTKTVYGADNLKKQTLSNTYQVLGEGITADMMGQLLQVQTVLIGPDRQTANNPSCYVADTDEYMPVQSWRFRYGATKLTRSVETTYDETTEARFTTKATETDYDPLTLLPRETRLFAEGGIVLGTRLSYPQDFGTNIPTNAAPELLGMKALQSQNAHLPIETIQYRQESITASASYKGGKLTSYQPQTVNGRTTALPYEISLAETDFGNGTYLSAASRYMAAGGNGITWLRDPIFGPVRLTMTSYDAQGNLTGYRIPDGAATAYSYLTYTPGGGVPLSVVSSQTQNSGQPNALTTSYAYTLPLLGLRMLTDPRGVQTTYGYDTFGRLQTVKDHYGKLISQYTYQYATAPQP